MISEVFQSGEKRWFSESIDKNTWKNVSCFSVSNFISKHIKTSLDHLLCEAFWHLPPLLNVRCFHSTVCKTQISLSLYYIYVYNTYIYIYIILYVYIYNYIDFISYLIEIWPCRRAAVPPRGIQRYPEVQPGEIPGQSSDQVHAPWNGASWFQANQLTQNWFLVMSSHVKSCVMSERILWS